MSTTFLNQIEKILNSSKFNFSFEKTKLNVGYNNNSGFFSADISKWEPEMKKRLFELLEGHKNKLSGSVPDELKTSVADIVIPVKETKRYIVTKEIVYFDPETFRIQTGTINMSEVVKGLKIVCEEAPEFSFVQYGRVKGDNPGVYIVNNGFISTASTNEWKKDKTLDPMNCFIDKVKELGSDAIKDLMGKVLPNLLGNETKVLERRSKPSAKQLPSPTEQPKVKQVIVVPTNEPEAQAAIEKVVEAIKGEIVDIYESWNPEEVEFGLTDILNPFVQFHVEGFLHDGYVRVILNTEKNTTTIELLAEADGTEDDLLVSVPGIKLTELQDAIDRLVEFEGDDEVYAELVKEAYPEEKKMKKAA